MIYLEDLEVISNCSLPAEKISEFLDHQLKSIMEEGGSYIKDTKDFLKKIQNMRKINQNSTLKTADAVGLYASIPHNTSLEALKGALDCRQNKGYLLICSWKWQELFSLTNALSLGKKYSIKFIEPLLALNLHHLMRALLCISLKQVLLKRRNCSHLFGFGIQMVYSLYGLMVKVL